MPPTTATANKPAPSRHSGSRRAAVQTTTQAHAQPAPAHQSQSRQSSKSPFLVGPAASSGGISAIDAITFLLAAIVILSPLVPLLRRALAKTRIVRSGPQS